MADENTDYSDVEIDDTKVDLQKEKNDRVR